MSENENKGNDFIFNLSLAEIAFIIILALVLLIGWPLKEKIQENNLLQEENNKLIVCKLQPTDPKIDPDQPETLLTPCDRCVANVRDISLEEARHIRNLGEVTRVVLTEVNDKEEAKTKINELLQSAKDNKLYIQKITKLQSELDSKAKTEQENIELKSAQSDLLEQNKTLNEENQALKSELENLNHKYSDQKLLAEENKQLKLANDQLHNKLAYGDIYPPCMQGQTRKRNGEIDKWDSLFRVYMREDDVVVRLSNSNTLNHPALDSEIKKLVKSLDQRSQEHYLSWEEFDRFSQRIDDWAARQEPRCRMVVLMYNRIKDAAEADEKRLRYIENRYYKQEMSRRLQITIPEPVNQGQ